MTQDENTRQLVQHPLPASGDYLPSPNRGVIDPFRHAINSHLDYFSATYPLPVASLPGQPLDHFIGNDLFVMERESRGVKHFRYGAHLFPSGRIYWNETEGATGSYVVLTGDDLAMVRQWHHMEDDALLRRLIRNALSVTRLDFAINITAGNPKDCLKAFKKHQAKTRVRSAISMKRHGKRHGHTVYFGSRQSDKMLRVYDKAAELKLLDMILTRIELQARKAPAMALAKTMIKSGVKDTGKSAVRQFVDFPEIDWYQEALGGAEVEMNLTPARETSFARWLNEQVLPAIEKRWKASEEVETITAFTADLMRLQTALGDDEIDRSSE